MTPWSKQHLDVYIWTWFSLQFIIQSILL